MELIIGILAALLISISIIITAYDMFKKSKSDLKHDFVIDENRNFKKNYFDLSKNKLDFIYFYGKIDFLMIEVDSILPIKVEKNEMIALVNDLIDQNKTYEFTLFDKNLYLNVIKKINHDVYIKYGKKGVEKQFKTLDFDLVYYINEIFSEK